MVPDDVVFDPREPTCLCTHAIGNNLTRPEKPPDVPEVHGGPRTVHVCVEVFELQKKRDVRREKKALSLQNKMREIVG